MKIEELMARALCKAEGENPDAPYYHQNHPETVLWEVYLPTAEAVLTEQMNISAEVKAVGDEALMEEKPADYIYRAMTQAILEGK